MKCKRDGYVKSLMEKYSIYNERDLSSVITYEEHIKKLELELGVLEDLRSNLLFYLQNVQGNR